MPETILEVKNVYKSYENKSEEAPVLNGISFEIKKGEFVAIYGESGAGKSTLLHLLAGFDKPSDGEILMMDKNITQMNENRLARLRSKHVGFVFQQYHLIPELSAIENVMFPMLLNGVRRKAAYKAAKEMLEYVGITEGIDKLPEEFSGGQNQRIAIARALVTNPEIVFADEPTGNLDSTNKHKIMDLLTQINKDFKTTILVVTHSETEKKYASKVILVKDGKVII